MKNYDILFFKKKNMISETENISYENNSFIWEWLSTIRSKI